MKVDLPVIPFPRAKAIRNAIAATIIYTLSFGFFLLIAQGICMGVASPSMPTPIQLCVIFLALLIILSIPISLTAIWINFFRKKYQTLNFFCWLPLLTIIILFLLSGMIASFPYLTGMIR